MSTPSIYSDNATTSAQSPWINLVFNLTCMFPPSYNIRKIFPKLADKAEICVKSWAITVLCEFVCGVGCIIWWKKIISE